MDEADDRKELEQRIGTTLRGKWTLERLLGVGGMAAVYVGRHEIGRREAIKILHPEFAKDADLRKRFEREAQAANRFRHPGAVEIHDMDITEDGAPFLVMELLEGASLADLCDHGPIPLPDTLRYTDELLDVLSAAHKEGIVHRDVKPDNLFVTKDGRLKVLDFGIARMRQGPVSSLYTKAGALLGTLAYMPAEQILGEPIDARVDLFAVGATMFRLIARRRLHEALSETDLVVKMATLAAPKLQSVVPDVPRGVALVVDRALGFAKEDRYPDAATMQNDVRAVRGGVDPPYAVRLFGMGLDPGAGAPSVGAPPPSVLTRARPPSESVLAMARSSEAEPPPSRPAVTAPATPNVFAPRAVQARSTPTWVWIVACASVFAVVVCVIGFSCVGSEAGHDDPHGSRVNKGHAAKPRPGKKHRQDNEE